MNFNVVRIESMVCCVFFVLFFLYFLCVFCVFFLVHIVLCFCFVLFVFVLYFVLLNVASFSGLSILDHHFCLSNVYLGYQIQINMVIYRFSFSCLWVTIFLHSKRVKWVEKYRNPHGQLKENLFLPLFNTNFISKSFKIIDLTTCRERHETF